MKFWPAFFRQSTVGEATNFVIVPHASQVLNQLKLTMNINNIVALGGADTEAAFLELLQKIQSQPCPSAMTLYVTLAGLALYLYDEWAMMTLKKISATTQSVFNTGMYVYIYV